MRIDCAIIRAILLVSIDLVFIMNFDKLEQMLLTKLPVSKDKKQVLQRRLNKLKRDPKGFLNTSLLKRKEQARKYLPIKYDAHHKYAVIASVYNVEKYIDEFFNSLINQSISFKKHIVVVCVDDGSTDNSAQIIKKWKKKYPKNILYVHKENGGLSSARNFGIDYILENKLNVDCITFPDPDDILGVDYFKAVDELFIANPNCQIVSCNLIYFYEKDDVYKDIHPLKYRYAKTHVSSTLDMKQDLLLSAATAVYKLRCIQRANLRFDTELKPSFEDCKFNNQLMISSSGFEVGFVREAKYLYRQREDGSSLMNGSWQRKGLFSTVIDRGVLDILRMAKSKFGYIPDYVQRVALFHCTGYYRRLVNAEHHASMLSENEKKIFQNLLKDVFTNYIDVATITGCNFPNLQIKQKIGLLSLYKQQKYPISYVYVNHIDTCNQTISISFFTGFKDDLVRILLDGQDVPILEEKYISNMFLDSNFYYERRMVCGYLDEKQDCQIFINGKKVNLTCFAESMTGGARVTKLIELMNKKPIYHPVNNSWILMDRKDRGDDNAEHLYRYIKNNHPEENILFAISAQSADWIRLQNEGFELLDYDSDEFSRELRQCKYLVSSHLFAWNHLAKESPLALQSKRKIWLQHGVICNNNSNVVNTKHMDFMITSTIAERESIAGDLTDYNLLPSQVVLAGLPRHDALLQKSIELNQEKLILIMPTWRTWLDQENLLESTYFNAWKDLLSSEGFCNLLYKYGYKAILAPHKELEKFNVSLSGNNDIIEIWDENQGSMQSLFAKASIMITDYSSVSFEMGFLKKPVCYFQFDKDEFFGNHYRKGYFDYEKDGFGPVANTREQLLEGLELVLKSDESVQDYVMRAEKTFAYRDGQNCERVYKAIKLLEIENPEIQRENLIKKTISYAKYAHNWLDIEVFSKRLLALNEVAENQYQIKQDIAKALYVQGKYRDLLDYLTSAGLQKSCQELYRAKLNFWLGYYEQFLQQTVDDNHPDSESLLLALLSSAFLRNESVFKNCNMQLQKINLTDTEQEMYRLILLLFKQQYHQVLALIDEIDLTDRWSKTEHLIFKPYLIAAKILLEQDLYVDSYEYIKKYRKLQYDYAAVIIIAQMDYKKGSYKPAIDHYEHLLSQGVVLMHDDFLRLLKALCYTGRVKRVNELLNVHELFKTDQELIYLWCRLQFQTKNWQLLLQAKKFLLQNPDLLKENREFIVTALYRMGDIEQAYQLSDKPCAEHPYEYWELITELAFLMSDKELAKYCYRGMVAVFPNKNKAENLEKLIKIQS